MRRDPSYDAEKLALGKIAILSAETAILGNVRPLRMHPRCGTIFQLAQTLVCVDEIKIKFNHKISARISAQ